ncbi:hypothetical protein [Catenulispora pinisilvae]|uniref:hypothetical protein n=1 Tax=Catenulispora pinisilvae TaxID=2705253 RepID=UPI0018925F93|nr:hypothetical protein [Catenulispora pinisilvae]
MSSDPTQAAPTLAGPAEQVPRPLTVVAAITAVQSVVALVYALWLVVESVTGTPRERGQAIAVGITFLILAVPLPLVPRALSRASMRGRTPAVMMQLLALWVAYFMVEAHFWIGAVPTVAAAVVGLVCIFTPASTAALTRHWREDEDPAADRK